MDVVWEQTKINAKRVFKGLLWGLAIGIGIGSVGFGCFFIIMSFAVFAQVNFSATNLMLFAFLVIMLQVLWVVYSKFIAWYYKKNKNKKD